MFFESATDNAQGALPLFTQLCIQIGCRFDEVLQSIDSAAQESKLMRLVEDDDEGGARREFAVEAALCRRQREAVAGFSPEADHASVVEHGQEPCC